MPDSFSDFTSDDSDTDLHDNQLQNSSVFSGCLSAPTHMSRLSEPVPQSYSHCVIDRYNYHYIRANRSTSLFASADTGVVSAEPM